MQVQDSLGFATTVAADTAVALAALPGAGFTLYSDATCATPATAVTMPLGLGTARAWFKGTLAGTQTVSASAPGLTPAQQVETLQAAAAAQLTFVTAPQTVGAGACSGVATVEAQDAFGNPATSAAARTLSLAAAPAAGFAFYADPGCATLITTESVLAGATRASLFFKGASMGLTAVTVSSAGLISTQQTETIVPGAPAALAFTSAPQSRAAGACSGAATLEVRDGLGNASAVAAATPVALSAAPAAGFTFYADAACATPAASVTVTAGTTTAALWFKGTLARSELVTATAAGLSPATQTETITAGADAALAFTTPPRTVTAGACSANLDVTVQDAFGNAATQAAARPVTLAAAPPAGFTFYADPACATAVGSVTVAAGASSASLYVKGTAASGVTVTASSAGVTNATQLVTVTAAATPTKLAFTTPARAVLSAQCSAVLTVQAQDSFNNPRAVAAATTVTLSAAPLGGVTFFTDATCATPAPGSALTIAAGTDSASFYVRGGAAGSVTVTASAAGLNPATQPVTVNPGPASQLVFTTAPQTIAAGACSALAQVQSQDSQGNVSAPGASTPVALASGPGVTFYGNATCTTVITGVTLGPGAATAGLYFRGTVAGPRTLTATAAGLTPANQNETVTPAAPSKLVFTSGPLTAQAGACSAAATVQVRDAFDNPVTLASPLPVDLTLAGVAVTLYSGRLRRGDDAGHHRRRQQHHHLHPAGHRRRHGDGDGQRARPHAGLQLETRPRRAARGAGHHQRAADPRRRRVLGAGHGAGARRLRQRLTGRRRDHGEPVRRAGDGLRLLHRRRVAAPRRLAWWWARGSARSPSPSAAPRRAASPSPPPPPASPPARRRRPSTPARPPTSRGTR